MATQYPSAMSLERLINISSASAELPLRLPVPSQPQDTEQDRRRSQAVNDAMRLILFRVSVPDKFLVPWNSDAQQLFALHAVSSSPSPTMWLGLPNDFETLPMVPSKQNSDLLRIFLKLLSRYKTSLDGNPDPNNPVVKSYFPFCIQDPLLLQIILYTSACFLNETGHMPKTAVMAHKGKAIGMLNKHLRSQNHQTGDAVIAGVVQLIVDEWYWGDTDDLRAHMRGLREMIRIRGGFYNLGMDGLLAKLVISHDIGIALAHEIQPFLSNGMDYDYLDTTVLPFRISHNTPFLPNLASFATSAEALGLHPTTASILDDVRFLINTVMSLPDNASMPELQKVSATASWMYERIHSLPEDSPDTKRLFEFEDLILQRDAIEPPDTAPPTEGSRATQTGKHGEINNSRAEHGAKPQAGQRTLDTGLTYQTDQTRENNPVPDKSTKAKTASSKSPDTSASPGPDYMYRVIRLAALVNIRAIRDRTPLSKACSIDEFLQVWTTSWRVPLTTWRCAVGIFNWAMVAIIPACHGGAHERFARTMYMISMISRAAEDWRLMFEASRVAMRLQRWLAQGGNDGTLSGGGHAVAKHGFLNTNWTSSHT
ncbi:hypothetical protein jhhlp_006096 [Lomentospora prolificans]|uniref:Transcription factor domain-containing protein n=1 Tax=Lomentospora prolificans TaxID=41688 RepID=A0A2N3N539_9PEZI|nr:hypothetical protein jhhlp_006096 [Lomentospora prolificans]